jgi:hypothetical protein
LYHPTSATRGDTKKSFLALPLLLCVKAGHEACVRANTSSNARKQAKRQALEMEQRSEVVNIDADLTDVHKLFEEKGQGSHLLEMDFEPVTDGAVEHPSTRTGKATVFWIWRHKLTEVEVRRYKTASGKSWDTGVLSRYLRSLTESNNKVAYERAQEFLKLNSKKDSMALKDTPEKQSIARKDMIKQWVSFFWCNMLLFLY